MDVDSSYIAVRAADLIAAFQAIGIATFVSLFGGQLQASRPSISLAGVVSAWAGIALAVAHHVLEAARMAGDYAGVTEPVMQWSVLASSTGVATGLRIAALGLCVAGLSRVGHWASWVAPLATLALAASFAVTGHTSTSTHRWLLAPLLCFHVAIAASWFGSLPALYLVVHREPPSVAGGILAAYSRIATRSVPLIAVAGVAIALLLLPGVKSLGEPYGELLIVKLGAFLALMTIAAANKWRWAPRIAEGRDGAAQVLGRSLAVEYAMLAAVIVVTAILTSLFSPDA